MSYPVFSVMRWFGCVCVCVLFIIFGCAFNFVCGVRVCTLFTLFLNEMIRSSPAYSKATTKVKYLHTGPYKLNQLLKAEVDELSKIN